MECGVQWTKPWVRVGSRDSDFPREFAAPDWSRSCSGIWGDVVIGIRLWLEMSGDVYFPGGGNWRAQVNLLAPVL